MLERPPRSDGSGRDFQHGLRGRTRRRNMWVSSKSEPCALMFGRISDGPNFGLTMGGPHTRHPRAIPECHPTFFGHALPTMTQTCGGVDQFGGGFGPHRGRVGRLSPPSASVGAAASICLAGMAHRGASRCGTPVPPHPSNPNRIESWTPPPPHTSGTSRNVFRRNNKFARSL